MGQLSFLTRAEIESLGPPTPEDLEEIGVSESFLRDLSLKYVAWLPEAKSATVAEKLHLPRELTEEILYRLYREKLIEMRHQSAVGATRCSIKAGSVWYAWSRRTATADQRPYHLLTIRT